MNRFPFVSPKVRRYVLLAVLLLASAVYVWQVATLWADQNDPGQQSAGADIQTSLSAGTATWVKLQSTGNASARGILTFDSHGSGGTLELWDMPSLSARHIYQMWRTDGTIADTVTDFDISSETSGHVSMPVIVDHTLNAHTRFFITIETAGGSVKPGGPVVLSSK